MAGLHLRIFCIFSSMSPDTIRDHYLPLDREEFRRGEPATGRVIVIAPTRAACETIELALRLHVDTVLEREHGTFLDPPLPAPLVHVRLRPEREHRRSREADVLPPAPRRDGEVRHAFDRLQRLALLGARGRTFVQEMPVNRELYVAVQVRVVRHSSAKVTFTTAVTSLTIVVVSYTP